MASTSLSPGSAQHSLGPAAAIPSRDWSVLLYIAALSAIAMTISQRSEVEISRIQYLLLVIPAVTLPLFRPYLLFQTVFTKGGWLLAMLVIGGTWHALGGDNLAVFQLAAFVHVYLWHNAAHVRLRREDLYRIYYAIIPVGFAIWYATDLNPWGPLPGFTEPEFGVWRISIFPNIAISAFMSLAVVMCLTIDGVKSAVRRPIFWIAIYFVVFSFVRTAVVGLFLYMAALYLLPKFQNKLSLFLGALFITLILNLFIAYSANIFYYLQEYPLISRLFLRGETGLNEYEIYTQQYRPWLWAQHLSQFLSSSFWMGWGSTEFLSLVDNELVSGLETGDSVSYLTRLLARYGLAGGLMIIYLLVCLGDRVRESDLWGVAVWMTVILIFMQWGTIFHPTDPTGFLLMLAVVKGRRAFLAPVPAHASAQPAALRPVGV